jgi:hypothetical protein
MQPIMEFFNASIEAMYRSEQLRQAIFHLIAIDCHYLAKKIYDENFAPDEDSNC